MQRVGVSPENPNTPNHHYSSTIFDVWSTAPSQPRAHRPRSLLAKTSDFDSEEARSKRARGFHLTFGCVHGQCPGVGAQHMYFNRPTHVGQPSIARSRSQRSIVSQAAESSSLADHQTRFDGRNKQALNEVLHDSNVVLHGYPQYACTQS